MILFKSSVYLTLYLQSLSFVSGLLDLANAYCEEALKRHCERIIRHGITTENAAMLYAVAIKYEATVSTIFVSNFSLRLDTVASYEYPR